MLVTRGDSVGDSVGDCVHVNLHSPEFYQALPVLSSLWNNFFRSEVCVFVCVISRVLKLLFDRRITLDI